MVLATKAGVNPENVYKAIRGGLAGNSLNHFGDVLGGVLHDELLDFAGVRA